MEEHQFLQKKRDIILAFLERRDISYSIQGRKDTVYCGKIDGEKIFKGTSCERTRKLKHSFVKSMILMFPIIVYKK